MSRVSRNQPQPWGTHRVPGQRPRPQKGTQCVPYLAKNAVAMEQQLKRWEMIDVAKTVQRPTGAALVVHAVAPATAQDLQSLGVMLQSAEVWLQDRELIHALRDAKAARGAALPESVWRDLPKHLATATPYLDTQDAALVYAFDLSDGTGKVVVRVNYTDKMRDGDKRSRVTTNFRSDGGGGRSDEHRGRSALRGIEEVEAAPDSNRIIVALRSLTVPVGNNRL